MDLEQLTKHQIILLTLLVSFMTSIATGIVTVSLMNQAPASVTRTINQIVERTVQTVVPSTAGAPSTTTTVKTVIVKNDDLVAQSIATMQKSLVRIVAKGGKDLLARGVIIDGKGAALTDQASLLGSSADAFEAILPDGTRVPAVLRDAKATSTPIAIIDIAVGTSTAFAPAKLADMTKVQLGQSVIRIGGKGSDTVGEGVIATLSTDGVIEASVSSATPGSILMDDFGGLIGITTTDSLSQGADYYGVAQMPTL